MFPPITQLHGHFGIKPALKMTVSGLRHVVAGQIRAQSERNITINENGNFRWVTVVALHPACGTIHGQNINM